MSQLPEARGGSLPCRPAGRLRRESGCTRRRAGGNGEEAEEFCVRTTRQRQHTPEVSTEVFFLSFTRDVVWDTPGRQSRQRVRACLGVGGEQVRERTGNLPLP